MRSCSLAVRGSAAFVVSAFVLSSVFADSARAGLQVPPVESLPATPTSPYLWFDGSSKPEVDALVARITNTRTSGYFATVKSYVNGRLASLATAEDDARARVAKGAALLFVLGQTPPASSSFTSYRDVVTSALGGVGTRQAVDTLGELFAPPSDAIDVLQDSSRLQSMAEAYDMIRGSGVADDTDAAIRSRLAMWADAFSSDWNLTGAAGIPGHRDNWAIKGGAALLTTALALPDHPDADGWRASGMAFIDESLDAVASTTGWYGESVWYLNYALGNLLSTAWHVKHATGVDWFPALRPFVEASLAWRQPDGRAPPFEEGIANTFPWDVMASAYPDLAPEMLWAWQQSPKNDENYENQQFHEVTRFILTDLVDDAAAPTAPYTRFLDDSANLAALRTSWAASALQVTTLTARDYSTSELNTTRHNMRNPLDVVIHGGGSLMLPTASGGPTVTTSTNRNTYLSPLAKNIPLLGKSAPFVTAGSTVSFGDRLDSEDEGLAPNHYVDLARTTLSGVYALNTVVSRTVALVDQSYVVVMDRFRLDFAREIDLSWRGRGARTVRQNTSTRQSHRWAGTGNGAPRLDLDVVGSGTLSTESNASLYADAWNHEEAIDGVLVGATAKDAAFISVFQVGTGEARAVAAVGSGSVAAATVTNGTTVDTLLASAGDGSVSTSNVSTDGLSAFVRTVSGALGPFAVVQAKSLDVGGTRRLSASAPVTLALTPNASGFVAELSADRTSTVDLELSALPGIDASEVYQATLEGVFLGNVPQSGTKLSFAGLGTGTLVVVPAVCKRGSGADPDGDRYCGSGDVCPTVFDDQTDSDNDGVGDACECLDAATRCDDQSPCSVDGCTATTGACTHIAAANVGSCDDGSVCTTGDHCVGIACTGQAVACDDQNDCTADSCDALKGCVNDPQVGQGCDDGDACTSGDACTDTGKCAPGAAVDCDDGDPCTSEACVSASGCVYADSAPGIDCDDGDRCTQGDACLGGLCAGSAIGCDDGNPCTDDSCDATLGCQHVARADTTPCDDKNDCTTGDRCVSGACRGIGLGCNDGDPCTLDSCTLGSGCAHSPAAADAPCDDDDPCTDGDHCGDGTCAGTPACPDGVCVDGICQDVVEPGPETSEVEVVEVAEPAPDESVVEPVPDEPAVEPVPDEPVVEAEGDATSPSDATSSADAGDAGDAVTTGGGDTSASGDDLLAFPDGGPQIIKTGGHEEGCGGGPASASLGGMLAGLGLALALVRVRARRASRRR